MIFSAIALLFALGFADARPQCNQRPAVACASGLHIVGVRGTLEDPGHGALQDIVDGLKEMYPGSDDYAIEYPAEGVTEPKNPGDLPGMNLFKYQVSAAKGYKALTVHLQNYLDQCEDTRVVLLGYSQGAHVVGDVLCGNTNFLAGPFRNPIDSYFTQNIQGVVLLGDPANNNDEAWHQGNGSHSGMFKRIQHQSCDALLTASGQSWCDDQDFFCEFLKWGEEGSIDVHLQYITRHKDEILARAKKLIGDHKESSKFVWQGIDL